MPETYKEIFPGNAVAPLNSYGLPTAAFTSNNRASGDPRDRQHQALLITPGWLAVRKVGYARINAALATAFDFVVPSPDQRSDDPPRADITGLLVPSGARLYRAGFRVLPSSAQPGASSQGPTSTPPTTSGIIGTATDKITLATATPAASAAGSIAAGAVTTGTDGTAYVVPAGGQVPAGTQGIQVNTGSATALNADLTFRLYSVNAAGTAAGTGLRTDIRGGALVVAEVCYLVPEDFADLSHLSVRGTLNGGTRG
jgi:hypothetical protein